MLTPPQCYLRRCKHYQGVRHLREADESTEVNYCPAFPEGIPNDIAYGANLHTEPHADQTVVEGEPVILFEPE